MLIEHTPPRRVPPRRGGIGLFERCTPRRRAPWTRRVPRRRGPKGDGETIRRGVQGKRPALAAGENCGHTGSTPASERGSSALVPAERAMCTPAARPRGLSALVHIWRLNPSTGGDADAGGTPRRTRCCHLDPRQRLSGLRWTCPRGEGVCGYLVWYRAGEVYPSSDAEQYRGSGEAEVVKRGAGVARPSRGSCG